MQHGVLDSLNWLFNGAVFTALCVILYLFNRYLKIKHGTPQPAANEIKGRHNTGYQWSNAKRMELRNYYGTPEKLTKREKLLFAQLEAKDRQLERKAELIERYEAKIERMDSIIDGLRNELHSEQYMRLPLVNRLFREDRAIAPYPQAVDDVA